MRFPNLVENGRGLLLHPLPGLAALALHGLPVGRGGLLGLLGVGGHVLGDPPVARLVALVHEGARGEGGLVEADVREESARFGLWKNRSIFLRKLSWF